MMIEKKGKTADITLDSDLTEERSIEFIRTMNSLIDEGFHRFNLDFGSVNIINAHALANLIIICDKPDLEFSFRKVTAPVMNIFGITKLNNQVMFE